MSRLSVARLVLLLTLLLPGTVLAGSPPAIVKVRIGLPLTPDKQAPGCTRNGAWVPVAITLTGGKEGNAEQAYRLLIETMDIEQMTYRATVAVPALEAEASRTVMGYIVPAGEGTSFAVKLQTSDGQIVNTFPVAAREGSREVIVGFEDIFFLTVGTGLPQLRQIGRGEEQPAPKVGEKAPDRPPERAVELDDGLRRVAIIEDVTQLPDRWIGYDAVDVVVLSTSKKAFVEALTQDRIRCDALREWVARGGQLVVAVGENANEVSRLFERLPVIGCKIEPGEELASFPVMSLQWCKSDQFRLKAPLQKALVARVTPGPRVDVLVREGARPILCSAAHGLGRVVLVAFDVDREPFLSWPGQEAFWTRMQAEIAPFVAIRGLRKGRKGGDMPQGFGLGDNRKYDMQAELKRGLEQFPEVPPISFGVVALFILFYILLVGPLDYFILKKLFKRLELTWISFPLLVIVVSVAAYMTASAVKGKDLRINKIDLVEVDLNDTKRIRGQTWFALFTPQLASFTIGIEPAGGAWTGPIAKDDPGTIVSLLEAGERNLRLGSRFSRPYEYAEESAGLIRVPIPVWSTRSFSASWTALLPEKQPIIGINDDVGPLRLARDGRGLVGRLTNNLPVRLTDVSLFYRGRWFTLGKMEPGEWRRIEPLFAADVRGQNREVPTWFDREHLKPGLPIAPSGRPIDANFRENWSGYENIKPMLFFGVAARVDTTNAGLRRFDQSWRLKAIPEYPAPERPRYRDEVLLVARTDLLCDHAEEVAKHGASASRLWLGQLPSEGSQRPALSGFMTQETYLRVFIPVAMENAGR